MRATLSSRGWHTTGEWQRKRKGSERERDENAEQIETGNVRRSDPFAEEESRTRHVIRYILSSFLARVRFAKQRAPNAVLPARSSVSLVRSGRNRYRSIRVGEGGLFLARNSRRSGTCRSVYVSRPETGTRVGPWKRRAVDRVGVSRRKNFFERCPSFVPARGRQNALLTYCLSNRPLSPRGRPALVLSRGDYFRNVIHSDSPSFVPFVTLGNP